MVSIPRTLLGPLMLVGGLIAAAAASALESPWAPGGKAEVRLLAAGGPGGPWRAGIEVRMAPGWHTYWRYPGDAGIPPRFDWSGSANLAAVEVLWPAPQRIPVEGGAQSIGYYDHVVFPLRIRPADPSRPVELRLRLDFAVCEKICIPAEARTALAIPPGLAASQPALDAAEARVPLPAKFGEAKNIGVLAAELERGGEPRVLVEVAVPPGRDFDLFAEGPNDGWALPLPERIEAGAGRARFVLPIDGAPSREGPIPSKLRLTLVAGDEAIEVDVSLD